MDLHTSLNPVRNGADSLIGERRGDKKKIVRIQYDFPDGAPGSSDVQACRPRSVHSATRASSSAERASRRSISLRRSFAAMLVSPFRFTSTFHAAQRVA